MEIELMKNAAPKLARGRLRDLSLEVKPLGSQIPSSAEFFFDGAACENIVAFAEACRECGT